MSCCSLSTKESKVLAGRSQRVTCLCQRKTSPTDIVKLCLKILSWVLFVINTTSSSVGDDFSKIKKKKKIIKKGENLKVAKEKK